MFVQHSGFCAAEKLMLFHFPCFAGDPSCFWGARIYLYFKYRSHPPSKWQKKKIWDVPVMLVWGNDWKMKKTSHFFPALDVEADDKPGMKESLFHQWITDLPWFLRVKLRYLRLLLTRWLSHAPPRRQQPDTLHHAQAFSSSLIGSVCQTPLLPTSCFPPKAI